MSPSHAWPQSTAVQLLMKRPTLVSNSSVAHIHPPSIWFMVLGQGNNRVRRDGTGTQKVDFMEKTALQPQRRGEGRAGQPMPAALTIIAACTAATPPCTHLHPATAMDIPFPSLPFPLAVAIATPKISSTTPSDVLRTCCSVSSLSSSSSLQVAMASLCMPLCCSDP